LVLQEKNCTTACDTWETLKDYFGKKSLPNKLFLRRKLITMKLEENGNIESHINEMTKIILQLESIGCKIDDGELVTILLSSLPESFSNLVISLESRGDDLKLDFVKQRLMHEFVKRKDFSCNSEDTALMSKGKFNQKKFLRNKKSFKCFKCNKLGHIAKNCWSKDRQEANKAKDKSS